MAIDYDKLKNWKFEETRQAITPKDVMLYALGVGLGANPTDANELRFVYEQDLVALPSMAAVLGYPGNWLRNPDSGVNYLKLVNAGNAFTIHNPIPTEGTLVGQAKVDEIIDKGEGRGALVSAIRDVHHEETGDLICTIRTTTYCRADGGFGGPSGPVPVPQAIPDTEPELTCDLPTVPQSALIYRLSGDYNPLHADPDIATKAGFDRPIAHGLLTYGVVCHALVKSCCGYDPLRFKGMEGRFSAPVFPGDTIRTEIWRDGETVTFRATIPDRDNVVVLNNGKATIAN
jgi:acyl dehydratase